MVTLAQTTRPATILVAEDDPNDTFLIKLAFLGREDFSVRFMRDGKQAIDYLVGEGRFAARDIFPTPSLLLLELRMPRVHGLQLLQWLDAHRSLVQFPVVVFTSSLADPRNLYPTRFDFVTAHLLKSERFDYLPETLGQIRADWLAQRGSAELTSRACALAT